MLGTHIRPSAAVRGAPRWLRFVFLVCAIGVIAHCRRRSSATGRDRSGAGRRTGPSSVVAPPVSVRDRASFFVIVMENHSYRELVGNAQAPYLNELIAQQGLATNYTDDRHHPSLPNYLEITSGSTWSIRDDRGPLEHPLARDNLAAQLEVAHVPWRAYLESMGEPCRLTNGARYAVRHNPFVYYTDFRNNRALCAARNVDFREFAADLAANTYRFLWITPDLCDDAHDCTEQHGDDWLRAHVPPILASPGYLAGGMLVITWDEGEHGSERIATVIATTRLPSPGFRSGVRHGHASLLATIEDFFGLPRLRDAVTAEPLHEFVR